MRGHGDPTAPRSCSTRSARSSRSSRPPRCCGAELARRFGLEVSEREAAQAIAAEIAYYRAHLDEGRDPLGLEALRRRCAGVLRAALPAADLELDPLVDALLASLRFTRVRGRPAGARRRPARAGSGWWWSATGTCRCTACCARSSSSRCSTGSSPRRRRARASRRRRSSSRRSRSPARVPDEAIHVGDSLDEDVAGARAAGIEPVLIRRASGRRRCPACGRSRVLPSWPGSGSRGARLAGPKLV